MTPRERDTRLDLVRAFSEFTGDDPDHMIASNVVRRLHRQRPARAARTPRLGDRR